MKKVLSFVLAFVFILTCTTVSRAALSPEYAPDTVLLTQTYCDPEYVAYDLDVRHLSAPLSECIIEIDYNGAVLKADTVTPENCTDAAIASCGAGKITLYADAARLTEEINRLVRITFAVVGNGSFDFSVTVLSCKTSGGKDHTLTPCQWALKMYRSLSGKEEEAYRKLVPYCNVEEGYIYALPEEPEEDFMKRISDVAGEDLVLRKPDDLCDDNGFSCVLTRDNAKKAVLPGTRCELYFGINKMLSLSVVTLGDIAGNDGRITAADSRAALRMAVLLDFASPEQKFAYAPLCSEEIEFSTALLPPPPEGYFWGFASAPISALARTLLRIAVGLEPISCYLEICYDE